MPLRHVAFALIVVLMALPAAAADPVLRGRLVTEDGAPVASYPVIIEGEKGRTVALTDEDGKFWVHDLAPGTYSATLANSTGAPITFTVEPETVNRLRRLFIRTDRTAGVAGDITGATVDLGQITLPPQVYR